MSFAREGFTSDTSSCRPHMPLPPQRAEGLQRCRAFLPHWPHPHAVHTCPCHRSGQKACSVVALFCPIGHVVAVQPVVRAGPVVGSTRSPRKAMPLLPPTITTWLIQQSTTCRRKSMPFRSLSSSHSQHAPNRPRTLFTTLPTRSAGRESARPGDSSPADAAQGG